VVAPGSVSGRMVSEVSQSIFKGTEKGGNPQRSAGEFTSMLEGLLGDQARSARTGDLGTAASAVTTLARCDSTTGSSAAAPATVVRTLDRRDATSVSGDHAVASCGR
jgi:hypothetical protein